MKKLFLVLILVLLPITVKAYEDIIYESSLWASDPYHDIATGDVLEGGNVIGSITMEYWFEDTSSVRYWNAKLDLSTDKEYHGYANFIGRSCIEIEGCVFSTHSLGTFALVAPDGSRIEGNVRQGGNNFVFKGMKTEPTNVDLTPIENRLTEVEEQIGILQISIQTLQSIIQKLVDYFNNLPYNIKKKVLCDYMEENALISYSDLGLSCTIINNPKNCKCNEI